MKLTSLINAAFSIAFIWAALDPLPLEISLIFSDFAFDPSVARFAIRKFQCSFFTSGGLGDPASINEFSLQRICINTLVIMGPNHFSLILAFLPRISQSARVMQHYKKHCLWTRILYYWQRHHPWCRIVFRRCFQCHNRHNFWKLVQTCCLFLEKNKYILA